jgi:hypothetical protein
LNLSHHKRNDDDLVEENQVFFSIFLPLLLGKTKKTWHESGKCVKKRLNGREKMWTRKKCCRKIDSLLLTHEIISIFVKAIAKFFFRFFFRVAQFYIESRFFFFTHECSFDISQYFIYFLILHIVTHSSLLSIFCFFFSLLHSSKFNLSKKNFQLYFLSLKTWPAKNQCLFLSYHFK